MDEKKGHIEVRANGALSNPEVWESECGGEVGVAFDFGDGAFLIPWTEMERIMKLRTV